MSDGVAQRFALDDAGGIGGPAAHGGGRRVAAADARGARVQCGQRGAEGAAGRGVRPAAGPGSGAGLCARAELDGRAARGGQESRSQLYGQTRMPRVPLCWLLLGPRWSRRVKCAGWRSQAEWCKLSAMEVARTSVGQVVRQE